MNSYKLACYLKTPFPSRRAARRRARHIRGTGGPHFKTYRCPYCAAIHLSHPRGEATHLRAVHNGPRPVTELTP